LSDVRISRVEDAGHMLHHDQPAAVARLIEEFMSQAALSPRA
jgi:pimeloyl-ACP methyl ester carboxylesterase